MSDPFPVSKHIKYPPDQHQVRLIMGDPVAQAAEWIYQYAKKLDALAKKTRNTYQVTFDDLVDTGLSHLRNDNNPLNFAYGDYLVRGSVFRDEYFDMHFWDELSILTGHTFSKHQQSSILY